MWLQSCNAIAYTWSLGLGDRPPSSRLLLSVISFVNALHSYFLLYKRLNFHQFEFKFVRIALCYLWFCLSCFSVAFVYFDVLIWCFPCTDSTVNKHTKQYYPHPLTHYIRSPIQSWEAVYLWLLAIPCLTAYARFPFHFFQLACLVSAWSSLDNIDVSSLQNIPCFTSPKSRPYIMIPHSSVSIC